MLGSECFTNRRVGKTGGKTYFECIPVAVPYSRPVLVFQMCVGPHIVFWKAPERTTSVHIRCPKTAGVRRGQEEAALEVGLEPPHWGVPHLHHGLFGHGLHGCPVLFKDRLAFAKILPRRDMVEIFSEAGRGRQEGEVLGATGVVGLARGRVDGILVDDVDKVMPVPRNSCQGRQC